MARRFSVFSVFSVFTVVAIVACKSEPTGLNGPGSGTSPDPGTGTNNGSAGSGSTTVAAAPADALAPPDTPPPDAATDFVASEVPACHAPLASAVAACLAKGLAGTVDTTSERRSGDVELASIVAHDGTHTFVLAKSGGAWRAVGRVFVATTGALASSLEITRVGETSHAARIDVKVEIVKKEDDDTDHETTKTAAIICPRGSERAIAACSKPYVLTCDSRGYTPYRSRATLRVRDDGTLAYTIGENAPKHSPCELPGSL